MSQIGFNEQFVLAEDRQKTLDFLTPASEDFHWYNCLNLLNVYTEKPSDKLKTDIENAFSKYESSFLHSSRRTSLKDRADFILKSQNAENDANKLKELVEWIVKQKSPSFNHNPVITSKPKAATYPSVLNVTVHQPSTVSQATDLALYSFAENFKDKLKNQDERKHFLQRISHPCYPNLPEIILGEKDFSFGGRSIHNKLTLEQLDELVSLDKSLRNNENWITAYLKRLQKTPDQSSQSDKWDYMQRLYDFSQTLSNEHHNAKKLCVIYNMLVFEQSQGNYNKKRFLEYLKIPKSSHQVNAEFSKRNRTNLCRLGSQFGNLSSPSSDEELLSDFLLNLLKDAKDTSEYSPYLTDSFLNPLFAEARITMGGGKVQDYVPKYLSSVESIAKRVDIQLDSSNPKYYLPGQEINLKVWIKNVSALTIKIFELNTTTYYKDNKSEIPANIELDGLVAGYEEQHTYTNAPIERVLREFKFPKLPARGVFAIELIGGGKSSRALIRRGQLSFVSTLASSGHVITPLDESHKPITQDVTLWLDGHSYQLEEERFFIPFTMSPSNQTFVLTVPGFSSLATFHHEGESYSLETSFYVDREQLLTRNKAKVLIRASLLLNSQIAIPLKLLENTKLKLSVLDRFSTPSEKETPISLQEGMDSVFEFQVPENSARFSFELTTQIKRMRDNQIEYLSGSHSVTLNEIDNTPEFISRHLQYNSKGYQIYITGKTGEPKPDSVVNITYKSIYSTSTQHATLQSNNKGIIELGPLKDIDHIFVDQEKYGLPYPEPLWNPPAALHGAEGDKIMLPWVHEGLALSPATASLYEVLAGDVIKKDHFKALSLEKGFLTFSLPAGDYYLKVVDHGCPVRVVKKVQEYDDSIASESRYLSIPDEQPLQLNLSVTEKTLKIHVENSTSETRVHVLSSFFVPQYSWKTFTGFNPSLSISTFPTLCESQYLNARTLGDEYMYILERKKQGNRQGNTLTRPSLLLNPWSVSKTQATSLDALGGGEYAMSSSLASDTLSRSMRQQARSLRQALSSQNVSPNLDFLAAPSMILENLIPNEKGDLQIDLANLGCGTQVRVVAVNPSSWIGKFIGLDVPKANFKDLRLGKRALDPTKHYTEQKKTSIRFGQSESNEFVIDDISTSSLQIYDTIPKVYQLLSSLKPDSVFQEFDFVSKWTTLNEVEKLKKYSNYACHELSFFVSRKDKKFFESIVLPYLANKKEQTFMDHYLLNHDLTQYLQPFEFNRLNIVEKLLLAERLGANDQARLHHYVKDISSLAVLDVATYNRIFDIALKSKSLDTTDDFGFEASKNQDQSWDDSFHNKDSNELDMLSLKSEEMAPLKMMKNMKEKEVKKDKQKKGFMKSVEKRSEARNFFQQVDSTQEYAENQYYKLPIHLQNADLVVPNVFWQDYADRNQKLPFVSRHFPFATKNFTEMMFVLSMLDIPFTEEKPHDITFKDASFILKSETPLVVFHQEVKEASVNVSSILISQNFFDPNDRYREEKGERIEKYIKTEFLVDKAYGCQVVMTNISANHQKIEVLLQVPVGAIPVNSGFLTKSQLFSLSPYSTQTFEFHFYFPFAGDYKQFPVHAAKNEKIIAFCEPVSLHVVETASSVDTTSWDYISQQAPEKELLEYMEKENLCRITLSSLAWRMKEKSSYQAIIKILKNRFLYNSTLWAYALHHQDIPTIKEWLQSDSGFSNSLGPFLSSSFLSTDPTNLKAYQHLEYWPLINERAHVLGKEKRIANDSVFNQYNSLLNLLRYKQSLTAQEAISISYYLLLQDRVDEALSFFKKAQALRSQSKATEEMDLQFDYMEGYFDFFNPTLSRAKEIVKKRAKYPIERWAKLFQEMQQQINEIESGSQVTLIDETSRENRQDVLASTEPTFDFFIENKKITLNFQNLSEVEISYFPMDIEFMFSTNPFVASNLSQFSYIKPNSSETVSLPKDKTTHVVDLPKEYFNSNIVVIITGAGISHTQPYYSNSMSVQVIQNYGQVKVTSKETGKPLSRVYVKVYSRINGSASFYKDGYTDLRGRFDYASKNTGNINEVQKFSILISSEKSGCCIKEANPPKL